MSSIVACLQGFAAVAEEFGPVCTNHFDISEAAAV
jgi:hypothetical protein